MESVTQVNERSRRVAAVFDSIAATYEGVGIPWFAPIAERLVAAVNPLPSWHVLDIGCGTGAALPSLVAAVGPSGRVVGIDVSQRMLDRAKHATEMRGVTNVELYLMDAMAPDLPKASFNAAVASLVAFFLPDPGAALRVWHDLLLPMGHLGITTFADRDPAWVEIDDLFTPYLSPQLLDARTTGARGPFASDAGVADLVSAAGFENVRTTHFDQTVTFPDSTAWRKWSMSTGQRALWESVPAGEQGAIERRAVEILQAHPRGGTAMALNQVVRITTALRSY